MQTIQIIQEIAKKIQINYSDLSCSHINYQRDKKSTDIVAIFKTLSRKFQYDHLASLLCTLIFDIYFSGEMLLVKKRKAVSTHKYSEIESENTIAEVDWEFYEQLHHNNQGKGWWNPGFSLLRQETDGKIAVEKKGIIFYIQSDSYLRLEKQSTTVGDMFSVYTPPGRILHKYYMAFGDVASFYENSPAFIYFNFNSEGAAAVMRNLTQKFNYLQIPFCFKVLHNPSNYGQYDSGCLRIDRDSYPVVRPVLQNVYEENASDFNTKIPIFTKMLAPGLALAENPEPEYEFYFREEFGINRCQIVANALVEAYQNGHESLEDRVKYIIQHFEGLGISLEHPYLNPNSEDIYTPLD
ncbi:T3SS effector HopA1 family protein [Mastigocoleus testarum]|uniref:Uncharacterized protein n=1 Tax=Mastigocoleus testarum BC008 TaxID=371196 RepID=A0A0V7ZC32_9CYAN|nr:T3SS effector HopA1 family protein [Mastigocoleus testarum]KST62043.1 hypothetical protein BC008_08420 [Mastigocoleus testarum BC008]KST62623.1 hypothetical protein BC008_37940 [Mastigocoleus testarum BC008]